jgi:hypothetical protein
MVKKFILDEVKTNSKLVGIEQYENTQQEIIKTEDYIIISSEDRIPKNLEINYISNNWKFSKFLNKILYELYKDNLGYNQDKSKYGIVDIYTLGNKINWSILNYFGGHKYIKQYLLDLFNTKNTQENKTPEDFYLWVLMNKSTIFTEGNILDEFIKTNMNTYNKGRSTENFVFEILEKKGYKIIYYPPGSKFDRDYGIDMEINGTTYQVKQLFEISEDDENYYLLTPLPKNYLGLPVQRIMLVNTNNAFFASFSNENYEIDEEGSRYIINKSIHKEIKKGNLNDL